MVITGASDGIGAAAARQLSAAGARVVLVGRSAEKTRAVADELGAPVHLADFAELEQVRELARVLAERYPRIDVLANNAGVICSARRVTQDGFEHTFQVNHLAPFLLTNLLMEPLVASRASVILTSSGAHMMGGRIRLDDLNLTSGYTEMRAYAQSKLANIAMARGLHERAHARGVSSAAFHPGGVATNFSVESGSRLSFVYRSWLRRLLLSPDRGADTLVWLAQGTPGRDWRSGDYFVKRKPVRPLPRAVDPRLVDELWQRSAEMVGLPAG